MRCLILLYNRARRAGISFGAIQLNSLANGFTKYDDSDELSAPLVESYMLGAIFKERDERLDLPLFISDVYHILGYKNSSLLEACIEQLEYEQSHKNNE